MDIKTRLELARKATKGRWNWWTSCSWKRLKSENDITTNVVAEPFVASDGHPDLCISQDDMKYIESLSPDEMIHFFEKYLELESQNKQLSIQLEAELKYRQDNSSE